MSKVSFGWMQFRVDKGGKRTGRNMSSKEFDIIHSVHVKTGCGTHTHTVALCRDPSTHYLDGQNPL